MIVTDRKAIMITEAQQTRRSRSQDGSNGKKVKIDISYKTAGRLAAVSVTEILKLTNNKAKTERNHESVT